MSLLLRFLYNFFALRKLRNFSLRRSHSFFFSWQKFRETNFFTEEFHTTVYSVAVKTHCVEITKFQYATFFPKFQQNKRCGKELYCKLIWRKKFPWHSVTIWQMFDLRRVLLGPSCFSSHSIENFKQVTGHAIAKLPLEIRFG